MQTLRLGFMLMREALSRDRIEREPEPTAEMDAAENVRAFHEQGAGPLLPVYHFNALAASRLLRRGGTVLDLGSGTGQFLAHLARLRPDIRGLGLDLAGTMVSVGQEFLADAGLSGRVELRIGDITAFADSLNEQVDLVTSIFALHHLPTMEHLSRCVSEIAVLRQRCGNAVWLFDHVRPHHPATPEAFPEIFTPDAPVAFRIDSRNSLRASYSFAELCAILDESTIGRMEHQCARYMRLYQVHWIAAAQDSRAPRHEVPPSGEKIDLSAEAQSQFAGLRKLFPTVPLS